MEIIYQLIAGTPGTPPTNLPDSGTTGLLLGVAVIGLGFAARFIKSSKK